MPHATNSDYRLISVTPLAPTFGAEVSRIDFSKPVPEDVFAEIRKAIAQYGVLVFRKAGLDDARHVAFSRLFGELDDVKPYIALGRKNRFQVDELFDVSNMEDDGSIVKIGSKRHHMGLGNSIFHVDSAFNPRRAGFSLLRAHELPPPECGGNTDFADTRAAYDDLPEFLKRRLNETDYIGAHSIMHSRKKAAPKDSPFLRDVDPDDFPYGRHSILQIHEPSGRKNLYIANHLHHLEYRAPRPGFQATSTQPFERVPEPDSTELIEVLLTHATQDKYLLSVQWQNPGDLVAWDNTCVMHRAGAGAFTEQGYVRDMRRTTVHDSSPLAWGFNERSTKRMGLP